MANNTLDKAIAAVPKFGDRISLFTKKLRLAQYADNSIYDYRLKIAQAVLFFKKLPGHRDVPLTHFRKAYLRLLNNSK